MVTVPADHKDLLTTHLNTENGDTSAKKWRCHHHYQAITHLNTENGHIPKTDIRLTIFRLTARSGSFSGRFRQSSCISAKIDRISSMRSRSRRTVVASSCCVLKLLATTSTNLA